MRRMRTEEGGVSTCQVQLAAAEREATLAVCDVHYHVGWASLQPLGKQAIGIDMVQRIVNEATAPR
jgi:hypothetical protein